MKFKSHRWNTDETRMGVKSVFDPCLIRGLSTAGNIAHADYFPPTECKCEIVRMYIRPPAIAGVLRHSSFNSVRPSSLKTGSAARQTTVPDSPTQYILSPARTGEPLKGTLNRCCQICLPVAASTHETKPDLSSHKKRNSPRASGV